MVLPTHTALGAETKGSEFTIKFAELVIVPEGMVTPITPVVALTGKVAVICVGLF